MRRFIAPLLVLLTTTGEAAAQVAPFADYHQHLFSPDIAALIFPDSSKPMSLTARDLIPLLDSAAIRRALVLSVAYMYGSPKRKIQDEYAKVRAENDWTGAQAAQYPDRLLAFCGFNPLKDYAVQELERCAKDPHLRGGIKLHFGNSDVQIDNPVHVEQPPPRLSRSEPASYGHRGAHAREYFAEATLRCGTGSRLYRAVAPSCS
jgi:uncharacterized protein